MDPPIVSLHHLDHLWFQIAGTVCNLTCAHCFISCGPTNHAFEFLTKEQVFLALRDSVSQGVKEYYFTGGEPFLHRDMTEILVETLKYGPATVLTNGTVLKDEWLARLVLAEASAPYSLEFRVSIDGFSPETNDPIRGAGTFDRAMHGVKKLAGFGFLPIITMARTWPAVDDETVLAEMAARLRQSGVPRPRIKLLPALLLGEEVHRNRGYADRERIDAEMLAAIDPSELICSHSRVVTSKGIYVCPILLDNPGARLGDTLHDSAREYPVTHGACYTCYLAGSLCSNPSSSRVE